MEALVSYSEAGECRHAEILTYYKDSHRLKKCGHCDVCDVKSERRIAKMSDETPKLMKFRRQKNQTSDPLTPLEEARFQILRQWRKAKAAELDLPAFVIFGDKTLRDLAQKNPQNLTDLKNIYGIGEAKLEKFGWDLLAEMASR